MNEYDVIGIMSGSSLDGLDVCFSTFYEQEGRWSYRIMKAETIGLPRELRDQLASSALLSARGLLKLDVKYGKWIGEQLRGWIRDHKLSPALVGIHGHTVFHEPVDGFSLQIGSGEAICVLNGIPVVDQFRTMDVLKGGQGAPLVPAGEHYLLPGYEAFLNLGGIANIAVHKGRISAWDIAPCNQVLNHFARKLGLEYDEGGRQAASGQEDPAWLRKMAALPFFLQNPPKSLSNQWTGNILEGAPADARTALHTYVNFLAGEINAAFEANLSAGNRVLMTGGGTFNNYLTDQLSLRSAGKFELVIPDPELVSFKEALIFGFLGLLKILGRTNVFRSVTGAKSDSVAGVVHHTGCTFPGRENC